MKTSATALLPGVCNIISGPPTIPGCLNTPIPHGYHTDHRLLRDALPSDHLPSITCLSPHKEDSTTAKPKLMLGSVLLLFGQEVLRYLFQGDLNKCPVTPDRAPKAPHLSIACTNTLVPTSPIYTKAQNKYCNFKEN